MSRTFALFFFFTLVLFAREERYPSEVCQAFNNMKHTQNTNHVILDTAKKYTVLKHHKGQNLILVKGENPAQRWVDDDCFPNTKQAQNLQENSSVDAYIKRQEIQKSVSSQKENLLILSWHNAFCETHSYKKECQRSLFTFGQGKHKEKHFVLHGLWPQPKGRTYCGVNTYDKTLDKHKQWHKLPALDLSYELRVRLKKVMPGYASNLHKHEWIKHGTCYSRDANTYYEDAVRLTEQFNASKAGQFFQKHLGQRVTLQQIRTLFDRSFGQGSGKRVEMKCKKGLITELWLHMGSGSTDLATLLKQGKQTRSYCTGGYIDKAGTNG